MRDKKFKRWFWEQMKAEADAIEREVNSNPELRDYEMSPEVKERIWNNIQKEIKRREAEKY